MKAKKTRRSTAAFVLAFLLAGALHVVDRMLIASLLPAAAAPESAYRAFGSSAMFVLNLAIYTGLLVWWIQSVRNRLLPSRGRTYVLMAASFMLFFLLERAVKYRLAENATALEHICWYAYYIPLALIPAMFLLTCLSMGTSKMNRAAVRRGVWGCTLLLILAVVTNDLHHWMFRPLGDQNQGGAWGTYTTGALWYIFYIYVTVCILAGLAMLALSDRQRKNSRRTLPPALLLLLTLGMMYVMDAIVDRTGKPIPFYFPEIFVFGMLGIFESCIRSRLIPFNENYVGFFARLDLAAEISDPSFRTVYATARRIEATRDQRARALTAPVPLDEDTRLYGRALDAGCAFWTGDESTLRRLNEELQDAAEVLETENELLKYENEQRETRGRVDARNRVYARAAAEVYDTQRKIAALLEEMHPDAPDYREKLARVLLLNAYVKRKTNLALLTLERDSVTAEELSLALEESARFLAPCGVDASVERKTQRRFADWEAAALYDGFEALIETLIGHTANLMASLSDGAIRVMAECDAQTPLTRLPDGVELRREDDQLYFTVTPGKGGGI